MTMLVGATLAAAPVDRVFADDNFYSLQKEIALGRQLAREVERQATMVRDPAIAAYLNRIGANLARQSDAQLPVTIQVIDGGDVNAFALPGGFIFVDSGLILKADDEAELAGVIAHCVGHVAARHGTREATESEIAQIGMIPLWFVSGWNAYSAYQAANVLIPMSFLQYSRAFVSEADLLGLDYMYKAGYDPTAFVEMLEKVQAMEKKKAGTAAVVYSTHPPTDERIAAAEEHIRQSLKPRPESIVNTSEFDEVRTRLAMQAPKSRASVASAEGHPPTLHRGPGD
jgi:predicted Zn-dependent protease